MTKRGTVQMARGWLDHPEFACDPFSEREAWAWMIEAAAFKPYKRKIGRHFIDLQRGQLCASERFLANKWKWTRAKVRRFLNKLRRGTLIGPLFKNYVTVITISKYDKYQRLPKEHITQVGPPTGPKENKGFKEVVLALDSDSARARQHNPRTQHNGHAVAAMSPANEAYVRDGLAKLAAEIRQRAAKDNGSRRRSSFRKLTMPKIGGESV